MDSSFNLSRQSSEMEKASSRCSGSCAVIWHVWILLSLCLGWNRGDAVKSVGVPAQSDQVPAQTSEKLGRQWAEATEERLGHPTDQCSWKLPRTLPSHACQGEWQLLSSPTQKLWFTAFITCLCRRTTNGVLCYDIEQHVYFCYKYSYCPIAITKSNGTGLSLDLSWSIGSSLILSIFWPCYKPNIIIEAHNRATQHIVGTCCSFSRLMNTVDTWYVDQWTPYLDLPNSMKICKHYIQEVKVQQLKPWGWGRVVSAS